MADAKQSKLPLILGGLAVVVIAAAVWFFTSSSDVENASGDGASAIAVTDLGEGRPDLFLGDEDAPIEVVEYASYTCPHCATFHENVYPKLKAEYIDTGKVKFIMREVYFDQFGLAAGLLARCAGDDRYYAMVDLLFEKQAEWAQGDGEQVVQNLYRIGRQAGMENDQMQACLQDRELSTALVDDYRLKAGRDDINATPSFIIDGEKVANEGWEALKSLLDSKLN